jgi:hypothetical protein
MVSNTLTSCAHARWHRFLFGLSTCCTWVPNGCFTPLYGNPKITGFRTRGFMWLTQHVQCQPLDQSTLIYTIYYQFARKWPSESKVSLFMGQPLQKGPPSLMCINVIVVKVLAVLVAAQTANGRGFCPHINVVVF